MIEHDAEASGTGLPAGHYPRSTPYGRPQLPAQLVASDLARARAWLAANHVHTPTLYSPGLSTRYGRDVWVKYESFLAIGSFKLRGASWAVAQAQARRASGVVTASTGNHGQGIALAATQLGLPATVFMPESVDPLKQRRMREFGADVRFAGDTLVLAEARARQFAHESGATFIEDGEDPDLMVGAASIGAEILEQVPDVSAIVVPVGGGNLAAATCVAMLAAGAATAVIGVQSTDASGATQSWLRGEVVTSPCRTLAGGLATERPGRLSLDMMCRRLDAMYLVDEDDLWRGVQLSYELLGHNLELAAAAPLAALERFGTSLDRDPVVLVATGGCIGADQLSYILGGRTRQEWVAACD